MKKNALLIYFVLFYTSIFAQFLPREDFLFLVGSGARPHIIDIDLDGNLDLVIAVISEEKLVWYPGSIPGFYDEENIIESDFPDLNHMELADLNGDGLVDIVIGTRNFGPVANQISWYENLGGGTFSSEIEIVDEIVLVADLELADMDEDGDIDIITLGSNDPTWYENDGTGTFEDLVALNGYEVANPSMIEIVDFDNDGDNDIFIGGTSYPNWVENLGGGTFEDGAMLLF